MLRWCPAADTDCDRRNLMTSVGAARARELTKTEDSCRGPDTPQRRQRVCSIHERAFV